MANENQLQTIEDSPQGLIAMAIQSNLDIDKLERLLALKERHDAALANKAFISALSNFQKDVPEITKSKTVDFQTKTGGRTSYKYAELGTIDESIKVNMAANGLSKRWEIVEEGDKIICTCIISHIDGHNERTTMSSTKDTSGSKNDIQSKASAITYLQRYTLIGALGLTTASEDNDGDGTPPPATQQQVQELPWLNIRNKEGRLTDEGIAVTLALRKGSDTLENIKQRYRINKVGNEELAAIKPLTNEEWETIDLWAQVIESCTTMEELYKRYEENRTIWTGTIEIYIAFDNRRKLLKKQTV